MKIVIFILRKVHHAQMMRQHRKISDDSVHCFQMTPFINWSLFIMIFINRKYRYKTVSGLFPSPCQTIWNWSHFTNLSSFHALIARSDSLQSRMSIYSTIHHHLLACFVVVQMLTFRPIFWYVWMKISLSSSFQSVATLWWNQHLGKHCPSPPCNLCILSKD